MTPKTPSSSGGSDLPPRHRPTLGNLSQDTTELDLWAFDDELDAAEAQLEPPPVREPSRSSGRDLPSPREHSAEKRLEPEERTVAKLPPAADQIRMNVNKSRENLRPAGPSEVRSKTEGEFDDLEHWEDVPLAPEIDELPVDVIPEPIPPRKLPELPVEAAVEPPPEVARTPALADELKPGGDDEFSPVPRENAVPVSLRPHLGLSKIERIGLVGLLVCLLGGGAGIFMFSLNRLPRESERAKATDFPIKGSHLTITSAASYWRVPITEGSSPDTFRRGTQLLPVIELAVDGGPAALRILFRNEERAVIGDAVTRTVREAANLKIAATAGFDDLGMHAAYRTGESKPWTIEVYEAPSEDTAGTAFKKLFEMNISTDRR